MKHISFPAEWYPQSAVQLTWPHAATDWFDRLDEVTSCFVTIAREILKRQPLIIVCADKATVLSQLDDVNLDRLHLYEIKSDDTWARDHGGISVFENGKPVLLDFTFNGWGKKFNAGNDNQITYKLYKQHAFAPKVNYVSHMPFILEGGSIESDGQGTLLTTAQCLMAPNRNQPLDESAIEATLKQTLGIQKVLWLRSGYLSGDDTDGHIDMLARFCNEHTIAYVAATDQEDEHTPALRQMEQELKTFRTPDGQPYDLIKLPMAAPIYYGSERLPASYANFLIINDTVLLPVYGLKTDEQALSRLQIAFPNREVIPINCLPLIYQHGSLHCLTMQYPEGFLPERH